MDWKQKRMGPVGCFGQIENIKRQSLSSVRKKKSPKRFCKSILTIAFLPHPLIYRGWGIYWWNISECYEVRIITSFFAFINYFFCRFLVRQPFSAIQQPYKNMDLLYESHPNSHLHFYKGKVNNNVCNRNSRTVGNPQVWVFLTLEPFRKISKYPKERIPKYFPHYSLAILHKDIHYLD